MKEVIGRKCQFCGNKKILVPALINWELKICTKCVERAVSNLL